MDESYSIWTRGESERFFPSPYEGEGRMRVIFQPLTSILSP
jgi:hypothetical protein